jgi:4-hydroxy-tetrahydrodipicolinate synthase
MRQWKGTGVALVTPFKIDKSIDFEALIKLVEFQIDNGIDYLVVLGTTAESAALTDLEKDQVIDCVVKTNKKRLPLVLGIGGNNTGLVCQELQTRDLSDFSAVLSVSPFYNKPTQQGIYKHFEAVSKASPLPIILYNVPGRTASNMGAELIVKLAEDFKNIVAVKEASGDLVQGMEILRSAPDDFDVISGDDMTALSLVLAGGSGVISVIGEGMPAEFSQLINFGLESNVEKAFSLQFKLMPIIEMIFEEGNPAGIKSLLSHLNVAGLATRLPLLEASLDLNERIGGFLEDFNS